MRVALACTVVVVVVVGACKDPRVDALEARVTALESKAAQPPPPPPPPTPLPAPEPQRLSLLAYLSPTFSPTWQVMELDADTRSFFSRDPDGFKVVNPKTREELAVVGSATITQAPQTSDSVLGSKMHSYSLSVIVRAVDLSTKEVRAVSIGQRQVMGISVESSLAANAAKLEPVWSTLVEKLTPKTPKTPKTP